MGCGRPEGSTRSSSCSPTTAGTPGRRASRSATPTRGTARGGWHPEREAPGRSRDRGLEVVGSGQAHLGGRILNIPVPHTGHTPFRAGRPLAILTCWAFEIFRFALHFTQYPSSAAIGALPAFAMSLLHSGAGGRGQDGDNIIRPAQGVGAGLAGGVSLKP